MTKPESDNILRLRTLPRGTPEAMLAPWYTPNSIEYLKKVTGGDVYGEVGDDEEVVTRKTKKEKRC